MFTSDSVWGIDIGDSCIKAVLLKRENDQLFVLDYDYIELDIAKKEKEGEFNVLKDALTDLQSRVPFEKSEVCLSAKNVNIRYFPLPAELKAKALEQAIKDEAEKQIPFPLEEVQWGYFRLPDRDDQAQIALIAVKEDSLDELLSLTNKLKVRGIQAPGVALYNYIDRLADVQDHTVILDFGERTTDLLVIHDGGCWMRPMPLSGHHITELLEKKFRIRTQEANTLKHEMERSPQRDKLFRVIEPKLKELVTEIRRSLNFRRTQVKTLSPKKFLAYGGSSQLAGVSDYFIEQLGLEAFDLQEKTRLDFSRCDNAEKLQENIRSYGVALGLAIQGLNEAEVELNLIPKKYIAQQLLREKRPMALIANIAFFIMILLMYFSNGSVSERLKNSNVQVNNKFRTIQSRITQFNSQKASLEPKKAKSEFILKLYKGNDYVPKIYDILTTIVNESPNIYLTHMELRPLQPSDYTGEVVEKKKKVQPVRRRRRRRGAQPPPQPKPEEKKVESKIRLSIKYVGESAKANQAFEKKLFTHPAFGKASPQLAIEVMGWDYNFPMKIEVNNSLFMEEDMEEIEKIREKMGWIFSENQKVSQKYPVYPSSLDLPVKLEYFREGEKKK